MHNDLIELGWTEEHWSRLLNAVSEEAQKARIGAQMLPLAGPEEPSTLAIPEFAISSGPAPHDVPRQAAERLLVDSNPTLYLTTIAVNVFLRSHEAADPSLNAALGMFRRAANYIARIEDALVFNGRSANAAPEHGLVGIPAVFTVTGDGSPRGLARPPELDRRDSRPERQRVLQPLQARGAGLQGDDVITAIIGAIGSSTPAGNRAPTLARSRQISSRGSAPRTKTWCCLATGSCRSCKGRCSGRARCKRVTVSSWR